MGQFYLFFSFYLDGFVTFPVTSDCVRLRNICNVFIQVGYMHGHCQPINKLTFAPDGNELISASDDHKLKVFAVIFLFLHYFTSREHITNLRVSAVLC
jgi:WD40 repeat protein